VTVEELEAELTRLIQSAPALDAAIVNRIAVELRAITGAGSITALAATIAQVLELVHAQQIDAGIALPALAMAMATLGDGVHGRLGARELEAARYEIDTLLPLPATAQKPVVVAPDVSADALVRLNRGPRSRT
jgi:hypothetical protein